MSKVLPGSSGRGMCEEKRKDEPISTVGTLNSGGPEGEPGDAGRHPKANHDRPKEDAKRIFRESDPPIVVRDGSAGHKAKGFNSVLLAKFMNMVMERGKKSVAERIVYGAIDRMAEKTGRQADQTIELLNQALDNVKPMVEVKSRRVGGATYQVPIEVRSTRRQTLAMRWVIDAAAARSEKSMSQRLAAELLEAAENRGAAVRKREDTHRMADANKAFAHYRW